MESSSLETNHSIPINNIYKVHLFDENGKVERIHIFCAKMFDEKDLHVLFSDLEIAYFKTLNVEFVFSPFLLHADDTVRNIKQKIIQEIEEYANENNEGQIFLSPEELYLFSSKKMNINVSDLFQEITKNKRKFITKEEFFHYALLLNLDPLATNNTFKADKMEYSYTDWNALAQTGNQEFFVPIGMNFQKKYDFLFPTNPYQTQISTSPIVYQFQSKNALYSLENSLLFNYIDEDTTDLLVCNAKNVFQFAIQSEISESYLCKLYFPFLEQETINSLDSLLAQEEQLYKNYKKDYSDWLKYKNQMVDTYYQIYWSRKKKGIYEKDLPYREKGIQDVIFTIQPPDNSPLFPLEYVFKHLHSDELMPYIRFNPGYRRESMFRLFSKEISTNGKKIPYLESNIIFKLNREMKKDKQISIYLQSDHLLYLYINKLGKVKIHYQLNNPLSKKEIEKDLLDILNPVFEKIKTILQPLGYSLPSFIGFKDYHISNMNFTYVLTLPLDKKISINKKYFLLPIFDITNDNINKEAKMSCKRVSNYKEMDAKASMIVGAIGRGEGDEEILNRLQEQFGMTRENAIIEFAEFRSQYQLFKEKILEHPGIPITLKMKSLKNELSIQMKDIDNMQYIDSLFVYLDTFLRLSQFPSTIGIKKKDLDLFEEKYKGQQKENQVDNIVQAVGTTEPSQFFETDSNAERMDERVEPIQDGIVFEEDEYDYEQEEGEETMSDEEKSVNSLEEELYFGGGDDLEERKKQIVGVSIKNPTPFFRKMRELDPVLYVDEETSKYPLYSKACPSGDRRQPVILTDSEKKKIDETNPGSYGHALHHGSDPKNKYWYICPRYWCLLTNSSISEEDVKAGKCGSVIPRGADRVPEGAYIYEFNNPKIHTRTDGKYIQHVPGFLKKNKHPDGQCIPCCFGKEWNSKDQTNRRKDCGYGDNTDKDPKDNKEVIKGQSYIIGPVSYPLPKGRWGFMPLSVQLFFNEDSSKMLDPQNTSLIIPNTPILLRYGIEQSDKRSFLSVFSYFYAYKQGLNNIPSLKEMGDVLKKEITLDLFVQVQNGNLPGIFRSKEEKSINIDNYKETQFFQSIDLQSEIQRDFLEDTLQSYENFLTYLENEDAELDHTFFWDIFCMENSKLMRDGFNLVILKINEGDVRETMQYLCPSNQFSTVKYDSRKETVILVLQDVYYEPIHLYENSEHIISSKNNNVLYTLKPGETILKNNVVNIERKVVYKIKSNELRENKMTLKKAFLEHTAIDYVKEMLLLIEKVSKKYCKPLPSLPRKYEFKRALPAQELMNVLKQAHYRIEDQVVNYRNKTIALMVNREEGQDKVYVPCYPSAYLDNINQKYMDEDLWLDYRATRDRLQGIYNDSKQKIPCNIKIKIVEDELVIGVLTHSNQFVQVSPPSQSIDDDGIPSVKHSSYLLKEKENVDVLLTTEKEQDYEREKTILRIQLETDFYNVFRSLGRLLLNEYENSSIRDSILETIEDKRQTYVSQLKVIEKQLHVLMDDYVSFQDIEEDILPSIKELMVCKGKDKCDEITGKEFKTCIQTQSGICKNVFPKNHLLGKLDNNRVYFGRLADELVRYERIRIFMLEPKKYLNIGPSNYQIDDTELFMLESVLQKEYFMDLNPFNKNKYIKNIEYDIAQPQLTQKYVGNLSLKDQESLKNKAPKKEEAINDYVINCIHETKKRVIGNEKAGSWKPIFPITTKEIIFEKNVICTFMPLIYILQDIHTGSTISVQNVKTSLWNAYSELFKREENKDKIVFILKKQGKKSLMNLVSKGSSSFESVLFSEDYYLTDFDYWALCNFNKIPCILFSSTTLKYLSTQINWLCLGGNHIANMKYYFIRSPLDVKLNTPSSYHLLTPSLSLESLNNSMFQEARNGDENYQNNWQNIQEYLLKYHIIKKK